MIVKRTIRHEIGKYLTKFPVLAVTGPRQSGKTTLLKSILPDYRYVSLENPDMLDFATKDPNGFLKEYDEKVIFDEVQQAPKLFSYLQTLVDEQKQMGQFILSGSQNFHLMERITQSLAGRVAMFKLFPFDFEELKSADLLEQDYLKAMIKGFYPAIFDREIPSGKYYRNYIQTYIQRDVSGLMAIKDMRLFRNFLALCADRSGQLLNLNALANDCGISQPTAKSWLSILQSSYIIFLLHPYFENFSKRVIKSPKLYFYDTGLLTYLLGFDSSEQLLAHSKKGNLFENLIIAETVKKLSHNDADDETWFWRDSAGHEIDLIIETGQSLKLFEIKSTQTFMTKMFKELNYFEEISKKTNLEKYVVFTGDDGQERSMGTVVPWKAFRV
jgi:predicted AAA+ superfamily ATPase